MKSYKAILLAIVAVAGLGSCAKDSAEQNESVESGELAITVDKGEPISKALVEVSDFPVEIKSGSRTVKSFGKVSELPASLKLDVGNYTVVSHTPGELSRRMDEAYYSGSTDVRIMAGITTRADVICKMQNSKIVIKYGGDFCNVFRTWNITVDDGTDSALSFSDADPRANNQTATFWLFENQVSDLYVNFVGYTRENNSKISQKYTLAKSAVRTRYDDDNKFFTGGDVIEFTFTPEDSAYGTVGSISLSASIGFQEDEETVIVNVRDFDGNNPGPDDDPTLSHIKLSIPDPITLPAEPSCGNVLIEAEYGISSLMVKVVSSNVDMNSSLAEVSVNFPGVDLVTGCEVVENTSLVNFLACLGQNITVPVTGDTEYTFPVGNFFTFLSILPGEHQFLMTVTDLDGNVRKGTLLITVPADE